MTGPRSVQPRSQDPETRAASAGFSASARVRAKAEFARTFADGRRIGHPLLALHLLRDPGEPLCGGARLGLAVSRKVDPRAVGRNRIKRVLRDAFRQQRMRLVPGSYVLVARTAARAADNDALRAAFVQLLQRADAFAAPGLDRHNAAPTLGAD